ncbi:MAG: hypothetical protein MUC41_08135 [Syntrophobacteraceae bacterium]|jgi:hypothetical protein|nr:hypothetical protein [Syntrophobacteraceae bacterium]
MMSAPIFLVALALSSAFLSLIQAGRTNSSIRNTCKKAQRVISAAVGAGSIPSMARTFSYVFPMSSLEYLSTLSRLRKSV